MTGFTDASVPDQSGKCFIVTGANTGLGFEATSVLASRGARVLLACRSEEKAQSAMTRIAQRVPGADLGYLPLDQGDLASVHRAAEIAAREPRIDVLVNNAGIMMTPLGLTQDGFEQQFGVNHLGTFALTCLLLPKLAETSGARVVVTSSLAHSIGVIDFANLDGAKGYAPQKSYSQSKLANLLFMLELDRRLRAARSPVSALACHPGVAATELMRHSALLQIFNPLFGAVLNTAAMGAWPTLNAATAPDAKAGGFYGPQALGQLRGPSGEVRRAKRARDEDTARRLWNTSIKMTGIDPRLPD